MHLKVAETLCKWHIRRANGTKWEHFAMTTQINISVYL